MRGRAGRRGLLRFRVLGRRLELRCQGLGCVFVLVSGNHQHRFHRAILCAGHCHSHSLARSCRGECLRQSGHPTAGIRDRGFTGRTMSKRFPSTNRRTSVPLVALLLATACLGLSSCAINPATGQGNLVMMSENRELEIGAEEHAKVMANMQVFDDEALNAYVNEVGQRMAAVSHRSDLKFTFTVIDSPEINAFALPGGYVY